MTEQELQAIEALAAAATPGPWRAETDYRDDTTVLYTAVHEGEGWVVAEGTLVHDAAFIAAARTAVPALVAEVRRLWRVEDAAKALSASQRSGDLHQSQRALLSFRHALGEP
jgi:hypothetical protein